MSIKTDGSESKSMAVSQSDAAIEVQGTRRGTRTGNDYFHRRRLKSHLPQLIAQSAVQNASDAERMTFAA